MSNACSLVSTPDLLMWAAAETTVIIIGASIPFLRKLLRDVFFRKPKPVAKAHSQDMNSWNAQKTSISAARAGRGKPLDTEISRSDDMSDRSILGDDAKESHSPTGIVVTQKFSIKHIEAAGKKPDPNSKSTWGWKNGSESE